MPSAITEQAQLTCDKGSNPSKLSVTSQNFLVADQKLIATEEDRQPFTNIPAFGTCTATRKNCSPEPGKWENISLKDRVNGSRILTEQSFCRCSQGGKISVMEKGYSEIHQLE